MTLNQEMTLEIAKMYSGGKSTQGIADKLSIDRGTVCRHLDKMSIKRNNCKPCYSQKGRKNLCGSNSLNWKGGKASYIGRIAKAVLINVGIDIYTCMRCGNKGFECLPLHHVDENRHNNIITNLEVLCAGCHHARHRRKKGVKR